MHATAGVAVTQPGDGPIPRVRAWPEIVEGGSDECLYLELLRSHLGRLRGDTPRIDAP